VFLSVETVLLCLVRPVMTAMELMVMVAVPYVKFKITMSATVQLLQVLLSAIF
jgi:hypothetical protein